MRASNAQPRWCRGRQKATSPLNLKKKVRIFQKAVFQECLKPFVDPRKWIWSKISKSTFSIEGVVGFFYILVKSGVEQRRVKKE
jgi:hypothetical protein